MSAATQGPGKVFFVSTIRSLPRTKQGPTARAVKDQSTDPRETGLWYRPASLPPGTPPRRHLSPKPQVRRAANSPTVEHAEMSAGVWPSGSVLTAAGPCVDDEPSGRRG